MNKLKKKIVIFLGYQCNNNCVFCMNADKRNLKPKSKEIVFHEIYIASKEKIDILELIGGETTIRSDFLEIISFAKKLGIKEVIIATNGRMFSDKRFAENTIKAGLDSVIFSIHGHNAKIHDLLTQAQGSFDEMQRGLKNFIDLGFKSINGNTTVVKQNMKYIPDIARFHVKNMIKNVEYIFVDPNYGGAFNRFEECVPKISEAAVYMKKAIDIGKKAGYEQWKVRYVPLCYFTDYLDHISEINERKLFFVKHWAPDFKNEDVLNSRVVAGRQKTDRCAGCKLYKLCEGIWVEYLKRYGDSELKAVR